VKLLTVKQYADVNINREISFQNLAFVCHNHKATYRQIPVKKKNIVPEADIECHKHPINIQGIKYLYDNPFINNYISSQTNQSLTYLISSCYVDVD